MEFNSNKPIFITIKEHYEHLIDQGALKEGIEMPSVREVALVNGVNPNTVQRAFSMMVEDGYLVSGCYVKARLNYTYIWRTYDCFVRNEGPNIITESRTFHENDLNLAFIFGYQYVGRRGFVFDIFGGGNIPLVYAGRFHTRENPGYCHTHWAWFTGGIRLGWAF